ncbi:tetratricopeptide repeat protein [Bernardetia sp. ABR2-2B]|uniref:tetratricopeptide repeat protein n=1 Tax=Bernardetia sp. ABR2-2B TaxID=3127472 RepID=UPI0030CD64C0
MTKSIIKSIVAGTVFAAGSLIANGAFAQNGALINAEFYVSPNEAKYEKALEKVRQATYHKKTKDKAKTYYVRAKVFTAIYEAGLEDEEVAALVENPIDSAFASIEKALEMEKAEGKDKYTKRIEDPVFQSDLGMETGLQARLKNAILTKVQKYQDAEDFESAYVTMLPLATYVSSDTTNLIYTGYFANKSEKFGEAAKYYEQLGDMDEYTGAMEAYQSAAYSYYQLEDSTNFLRILEKGAERFPKETYFVTNIADVYIKRKDYTKAIELLKKANEIEPSTKTLTNIAIMYQSEGQPKESAEYYKKVLELDPQDYDATFALAINYYRRAADVYNKLEVEEQEPEHQKMKPILEDAEQSINYAKKAIEINDEDITLYNILKDLYTMKDDTENAKLMKKKIDAKK